MNTRVSEKGFKSQLRGKPAKDAVETAIGASSPDEGTVQTTNLRGGESRSGTKICRL